MRFFEGITEDIEEQIEKDMTNEKLSIAKTKVNKKG
jgi:hypothetical protein